MTGRRLPARLAMLALLQGGWWLWAHGLGASSLWDDEGFTVHPPPGTDWDIPSAMPFSTFSLHYHLVRLWAPVGGGSEYALRFPSLWAATALVAVAFAIGRRLGGDRVGLGAALLAVLSPPMLYHAQSARSYALLFLFLGLTSYALLRLQARPEEGRWWAVAAAGLALGAYSHLWALSALPAAGLAMAWAARRGRGSALRAGAAVAGVGAALLPWLARPSASRSFGNTLEDYAGRGGELVGPLAFLRDVGLGMLATDFEGLGATMGPLTATAAGFALLVGAAVLARRRPVAAGLAGLLVAGPLALSYAVVQVAPYFASRYVLFLAPLLWGVAAGGLALRGPTALVGALPLAVVVAGWAPHTYAQATTDRREDLGRLAAEVRAAARPGDALVVTSGWREPNLAYYLQGVDLRWVGVPVEAGYTVEGLRAEADRLAASHRRVWVAFFGVTEANPTRLLDPLLSDHYARVHERWHGTTRLALFAAAPGADVPPRPLGVVFGDALELVEARVPPLGRLAPGDEVAVGLRWRVRRPGDYGASMRLLDEQGRAWVVADNRPRNGHLSTGELAAGTEVEEARGLVVPWGTPPGSYRLVLAAFAGPERRGMGARDREGRDAPQELPLGRVEVGPADLPVPAALLPVERHVDQPLGGLHLAGGRWPERTAAGGSVDLDLVWWPRVALSPGQALELRLRDDRARVVATRLVPLLPDGAPPWPVGEPRLSKLSLPVPPRLAAGQYRLELAQPGAAVVPLGELEVESRPRRFEPPPVEQRSGAVFGEAIELLGYSVDADVADDPSRTLVAAGGELTVRLAWRLGGPRGAEGVDSAYTVFVQLLDPDGKLVAQHDGQPADGAAPTTSWVVGEVVEDRHVLRVPPTAGAGSYRLIAGLYDARTLQRLPVAGGDHVMLAELRVG